MKLPRVRLASLSCCQCSFSLAADMLNVAFDIVLLILHRRMCTSVYHVHISVHNMDVQVEPALFMVSTCLTPNVPGSYFTSAGVRKRATDKPCMIICSQLAEPTVDHLLHHTLDDIR